MTGFENRVLATIRRFSMFAPRAGVAVAVSGGPDSVALLLALEKLRGILKHELSAIHFNHQVRGSEADRDEHFVCRLCEKMGIPLQIGRRPSSSLPSGNLEEELRAARYGFFGRALQETESRLATGHTLDDQAETVLLKLFRGAGPRGLAGIYPVRSYEMESGRSFQVIRPLIELTRPQVLEYLRERDVGYCKDSSNFDMTLDRNWVRGQLIPSIRERLNQGLATVLGRNAALQRDLVELMDQEAERFLATSSRWSEHELSVDAPALAAQPPFWRGEIVRECARRVWGGNDLEFEHVMQIEALLERQSGRRFEGPGRLRVWKEHDRLIFSAAPLEAEFEIDLSIPGGNYVEETGLCLRAWRGPKPEIGGRFIDLAFDGERITVRNLRPGDRIKYQAGGRTRLRKVADLLADQGLSNRQRRRRLVVESDGEILWVDGLGVAADRQPGNCQQPCVTLELRETSETSSPARVLNRVHE